MVFCRLILVATVGWFITSTATAQCWECDDISQYPGIQCAPVSVSDDGWTECHVVVDSVQGNHCAFENVDTGESGLSCEWEPPPGNGHNSPPDQGCEWSNLLEPGLGEPVYRVTPNGEAAEDWEPETPALDTAVG